MKGHLTGCGILVFWIVFFCFGMIDFYFDFRLYGLVLLQSFFYLMYDLIKIFVAVIDSCFIWYLFIGIYSLLFQCTDICQNDIISFVNENEAINYCNSGVRFWYEQTVFPWWVFRYGKLGYA